MGGQSLKASKWWAIMAAFWLIAAGCSSGSDPTTTTAQSSTSTTPTTALVTTSTTAPAFDIPVQILTPRPSQTLVAKVDRGDGTLAAEVRLTANLEIPAGETVTVAWASDIEGGLGEGTVLDVELGNDGKDVAGHRITVTVTSSGGGFGTSNVFVLVQVPSN